MSSMLGVFLPCSGLGCVHTHVDVGIIIVIVIFFRTIVVQR